MSDYPDFTITALLKGIYDEKPKALAVDVEGNLNALLKGWFGTTPKPLNLDQAGNITAMLKGMDVATPTNIQVDGGGNIQVSLVAQELGELINRFKYGAPDYGYSQVDIEENATETLITILGKGQVYAGLVATGGANLGALDTLTVEMDDEVVTDLAFNELYAYGCVFPNPFPVTLTSYDLATVGISALLTPGYTFESKYTLRWYHSPIPWNGKVTVQTWVYFSLISGTGVV